MSVGLQWLHLGAFGLGFGLGLGLGLGLGIGLGLWDEWQSGSGVEPCSRAEESHEPPVSARARGEWTRATDMRRAGVL